MGREVTKHTKSQCEMILDYMRSHKSISQAVAVEKFDCYRLSARIFDLRDEGYEIKKTLVKKKNKEGNTVQYAEYSLVSENADN